MRKGFLVVMIIVTLVIGLQKANSQDLITIGSLKKANIEMTPFRKDLGNGWNRNAFIYPSNTIVDQLRKYYSKNKSEEEYARLMEKLKSRDGGFYISSVAFHRLSIEKGIPANTSRFKIFVKNTERSVFNGGADWKKELNDAFLVYDGDPTEIIGNTNGYKTFKFSKPFQYTGQSLEFLFEFYTSQSADPIIWTTSGNQELVDFKASSGVSTSSYNGSLPPVDSYLGNPTDEHPDIRLGFTTDVSSIYVSAGTGMEKSFNNNPISNGNTGWSRSIFIYPFTMLSGLKNNTFVNALELYRLDDGNSLGTGNNLKIYIKNSSNYSFDAGTSWLTESTDAVLVYDDDPQNIVSNYSGYKRFPFKTPFFYTGDNLEIIYQYTKVDNNGGNDQTVWSYTNRMNDHSLDGNQGIVNLVEDGSTPDPTVDNQFSNFADGIPSMRLVLADPTSLVAKGSLNGTITNGNRTYNANLPIYPVTPNTPTCVNCPTNGTDADAVVVNGVTYNNNYLLLHEAVDPNNFRQIQIHFPHGQIKNISGFQETYVQGKISARTGGNGNHNRKLNVEVNTSAAFTVTQGSLLCYNEPERLVTLYYKGTFYLAIEIPITVPLYDFAFTGYTENASLNLITGNNLGDIDFNSIQPFNNLDFPNGVSANLDVITTQGAVHVGQEIEINNMVSQNNPNVDAHLILSSSDASLTNKYSWQINTSSDHGSSSFTPNGFDVSEIPSNGNVIQRICVLPSANSIIATSSIPNPLVIKPDGGVAIGFPWIDRTAVNGYDASKDKALNNPFTLAVNGVIGAKKVKVTQDATVWPDYVFDSSYKLQSLESIETFIKANKHLPEVPSSAEVKEAGVDVGDHQALLLKKVEELTLYMIQQQKQMIELNAKNEKLQKEVEELKKKK